MPGLYLYSQDPRVPCGKANSYTASTAAERAAVDSNTGTAVRFHRRLWRVGTYLAGDGLALNDPIVKTTDIVTTF